MADNSNPGGAVFLSYAREDGAAARRIAEALRGFGIEVWFDLSELRGGDVWDQKIRRQIKECTLFMPVISATTQSRDEGYFRREWRLAVDRTHDMAEHRAFFVPVIIDDTREADASVPEQFFKAHFTRLAGGEPTPQFVEQVKRLLQPTSGSRPPTRTSSAAPVASPKRGLPWISIVLGVAVVGLVAFILFRPASKPEPVAPATAVPPIVTSAKPAESAQDSKSIAVLPFVDMSQAKDQEYFSDGLSEELLNLLAKVSALKVTSRSSAFSYKGKEVKLSQVAKELGVAHVLEGSVRKSGNRLRITAQLIDARTDTHLWSETYDRSLDDIFAVQDEIATAVVKQLRVTLLGETPKSHAADPKAYAMYLEARALVRQGSEASTASGTQLLREALAIDPTLAVAWVTLAQAYTNEADAGIRSNDDGYRLGLEAVNRALAIDPNLATAYAKLAHIQASGDADLTEAARSAERALTLDPTNIDIIGAAIGFARSLGRYEQAVKLGEYVVAHDPLNASAHGTLGAMYIRVERYDEGIAVLRTALRLAPDRIRLHYTLGMGLLQRGDAPAALKEMLAEQSESWRLDGLAHIYHALGRKAESDAALRQQIEMYEKDSAWNIAYIYAYRGEADRCFEWLDKAIAYRDPGLTLTAVVWSFTNVHQDPRWLPFLRRINRAPEQVAAVKFDVKLPSH